MPNAGRAADCLQPALALRLPAAADARRSVLPEVVVQCIPGSRLVVIPKATHLMSHQDPTAFNEALLHFLG